MSGAMRAVAAKKGVEYLDVQRALDGHQVCDRRAAEVGRAARTRRRPNGPAA